MKNYYDILGIKKDATLEEIKIAYRKRAKETHPDILKGSNQVNEAYMILSLESLRQKYDEKEFDFEGFNFIFNPNCFDSEFGFSLDSNIDKSIRNICATHIAYFLKFAHHNDVDAFNEFKYKYFKENVIPDLSNFLNQPALDGIEVNINDQNIKPLFNIVDNNKSSDQQTLEESILED